jgi:hypothetical protein
MAGITRVTDVELDGSTVTVTFGRHEIKALSASYGDTLETEVVRMMGSQLQHARTAGTYKTETVKIKFRASVFRAEVMPLFPVNGGGNVRVPITVNFSHPDIGSDSDLLDGARCTNWTSACEASSKALEVETSWEILQVYWTSERKTLNAINGIVPSGAASF